MKNNKGFGKFEVLTVIVLIMALSAFLLYVFLGGTTSKKIDAMKDSAISFSKVVTTNIASFHNTENVYLQEAIDEGLLKDIKSPVGGGNCSGSESLVQLIDGMPYVTLKCGKLLIEKTNFSSKSEVNVYEVSNWTTDKLTGDNVEEKELYNCEDNGKELFSEYNEELFFVYKVNQSYETSHFFADSVGSTCKVLKKTFYRTKKPIEQK